MKSESGTGRQALDRGYYEVLGMATECVGMLVTIVRNASYKAVIKTATDMRIEDIRGMLLNLRDGLAEVVKRQQDTYWERERQCGTRQS